MGISLKKLALNEAGDFPPPPPPLPRNLPPIPKTLGKHENLGRKVTPDVEDLLLRYGYEWHPIDKGYLKNDGKVLIQFYNDLSSVASSTKNPNKKLEFPNVGALLLKLSQIKKMKKKKPEKGVPLQETAVKPQSKYKKLFGFLYS